MVKPGMLDNPALLRWLDGVEPAWTLLESQSFNALRRAAPAPPQAIRMSADLALEDARCSPVAANARLLLVAASAGPGLQLTATGNLARNVVLDMLDTFAWPGFDKAYEFRLHKVINEPDYLPLFFTRQAAESAGFLRKHGRRLRLTPAGRRMLDPANTGSLLAELFRAAFWKVRLSYLSAGLHDAWPQYDFGIVLWCLSIAGGDWQTQRRLTRLCTIPINGVIDAGWDTGSMATEARILQPLVWFGLMETRPADGEGPPWQEIHLYRKAPLFDRFLAFDVAIEPTDAARH